MDNNHNRNFIASLILAVVFCGFAATLAFSAAERQRDLSVGVIENVRCRGRRLDLNLKTPSTTLHLYIANYTKLELTAANFTPKGKLDPCRQITGFKATAVFYDVPRRPNEGELISMNLSKPEAP